MKPIQVMIDEDLLRRFDADEEVQREGRSAVLRRVLAEYLERRRRASITTRYQAAYGAGTGLGDEFAGWEDEGSWPDS